MVFRRLLLHQKLEDALTHYLVHHHITDIAGIGQTRKEDILRGVYNGKLTDLYNASGLPGIGEQTQTAQPSQILIDPLPQIWTHRLLRPPQKVVTDLLLHCRDLREGLLQQFLLDVAQLTRMDDVGRRPPGLDGRQLRAEPQLHQEVVRRADLLTAGRHNDAAFGQRFDALQRVRLVHLMAQRIQSRKADHRHHGVFEIDLTGVFGSAAAQIDVARQPEGRLERQSILREVMIKGRLVLQGRVNVAAQFLRQLRRAVHRAKVEEDAEVDHFLRLRFLHPRVEAGDPIGQGAAPARIARHHLTTAQRITGAMQIGADARAQLQEVSGHLLRVGINRGGEDDAVVLIGQQRLLLTPLTAHGDEGKRRGRRAEIVNG